MTDTFRALCAELVDAWLKGGDIVGAMNRARAALDEADEPAVPQGREPAAVTGRPSDEELLDLLPQGNESGFWLPKGLPSDWVDGEFIAPPKAIIAFARAVLARWGNHVPAPPADGEVAELVRMLTGIAHWRRRGRPGECDPSPFDIRQADRLDRAAELLQRQALVLVAVSERLPGPEDCDAEGRCWWGRAESDDWSADWTLATHKAVAEFCEFSPQTVWLPAHALPLPEVGE